MSKLALLVVPLALAGCANAPERSAASLEAQLPQLVAACNAAADAGIQSKGMRACETLVEEKLLHLVEPHAFTAYWNYQARMASWQACARMQARVPNGAGLDCHF